MTAILNSITISQLRKETIPVLEKISSTSDVLTVFSRSKPVAVLMSYATYLSHFSSSQPVSDKEWHDAFSFLTTPKKKLKGIRFDAVKEIRKLR